MNDMNTILNLQIKKKIEHVNEDLITRTDQLLQTQQDVMTTTDDIFVVNALLSDDELLNEWAFRQPHIGKIINQIYNLDSADLAQCETVEQIVDNQKAVDAIYMNRHAIKLCAKNPVLLTVCDEEVVLSKGIGYRIYNIGDLVQLTYDGIKRPFRVVDKDYGGENRILLINEYVYDALKWNTDNDNVIYSQSHVRRELNNELINLFSPKIKAAMKTRKVDYQASQYITDYEYDKISLLSIKELCLDSGRLGKEIAYFKDKKHVIRLNYINPATPRVYWLRDAELKELSPSTRGSVMSCYCNDDHISYKTDPARTANSIVFAFEL